MQVTKLRTKEEQEIAVMFLTDKGWSKTEISRALGYNSGSGVNTSLRREGLPPERAGRLSELVCLVEENPKLKRPGMKVWPIDQPLPVRRVPNGGEARTAQPNDNLPATTPQTVAAYMDDNYPDRLTMLDACRKDAERIRARLQKGLADAPPILRAGMQEAMARAQDLAALLTV